MTLKLYNTLTDRYGFIIPLVVQGGMVVVSMLALASGTLVGIGYVLLGIAAVAFAPRAFEKGIHESSYIRKSIYFVNWVLLAFFSVYIGISFAVAGTLKLNELSTVNITQDNDVILIEYRQVMADVQAQRASKAEEFAGSARESTIGNIQGEQARLSQKADQYQQLIIERTAAIASGQAERDARKQLTAMTADDIFKSVPIAWRTGRRIQVIFWTCLIVGIELMIINALAMPVKPTRKRKKAVKAVVEAPGAVTSKAIQNWLKVGFYGLETGKSAKSLPKETCQAFQKKMGGTFDAAQFDKLEQLARKAQVIDKDNNILVADKATAAGLMEFNL